MVLCEKWIQIRNHGVSTLFLSGRIGEDFVEEKRVELRLERRLGIW